MKKAWLYILLPALFLNSSYAELFKLPKLFSHFQQHYERNNQIDIFDFISMHYLGNDIDDDDYEEDMKLPFKKMEGHSLSLVAIPASKSTLLVRISFFTVPVNPFFRQEVLYDRTLESLFRPPRA